LPRLHDRAGRLWDILGAADLRQLERDRAVFAGRQDALEADLQRCRIAAHGKLDRLAAQRLQEARLVSTYPKCADSTSSAAKESLALLLLPG
jgi:hypothetical protein